MLKKIIFCFGLALLNLSANELIEISDAYVQQTPPNAKNTAIFLTLKNKSERELSLVSVFTNLSDKTELHTHTHTHNKMSMVRIPKITLSPHTETKLQPGGLHIMVFDLKKQVDADTKADLTLYFDDNSSLEIKNIPSAAMKK